MFAQVTLCRSEILKIIQNVVATCPTGLFFALQEDNF